MRCILLIFSILLLLTGYSQDTIRLEPAIHYSSAIDPVRGKQFASRARFAREDIIYSATKKNIDYCYYYDTLRICYGDAYEIINDSTLKMNGNHWIFEKQNDHFFLHRYYAGTYEYGYARQLMPLEPTGAFTTVTGDRQDTLWSLVYDFAGRRNPNPPTESVFHKSRVKGKVYKASQVDGAPAFLNGDSIIEIQLARKDFSFSEPYIIVSMMRFVITGTGRIVNVELEHGNLDTKHDSGYLLELIRHIIAWAPVKPATKKGQPVNVQWSIHVDMITQGWDWRTGRYK